MPGVAVVGPAVDIGEVLLVGVRPGARVALVLPVLSVRVIPSAPTGRVRAVRHGEEHGAEPSDKPSHPVR